MGMVILEFLKKLRDNVVSILSAIVAFGALILFGWLAIEKTKKDADKALDQTDADKKKIADNDKQLAEEQAKRDAIDKKLKEDENHEPSQEDLDKLFNNPDHK